MFLETLNELMGVDHAIKAENSFLVIKKPTRRDERHKEKTRNKILMVCSLCYFVCYFKNG